MAWARSPAGARSAAGAARNPARSPLRENRPGELSAAGGRAGRGGFRGSLRPAASAAALARACAHAVCACARACQPRRPTRGSGRGERPRACAPARGRRGLGGACAARKERRAKQVRAATAMPSRGCARGQKHDKQRSATKHYGRAQPLARARVAGPGRSRRGRATGEGAPTRAQPGAGRGIWESSAWAGQICADCYCRMSGARDSRSRTQHTERHTAYLINQAARRRACQD
jgi:hypothetical protein